MSAMPDDAILEYLEELEEYEADREGDYPLCLM